MGLAGGEERLHALLHMHTHGCTRNTCIHMHTCTHTYTVIMLTPSLWHQSV